MSDDVSQFDYDFDPALIATAPMAKRDQSRLLIVDRKTRQITHQHFASLADLLNPNDLLVVNNTRVFPARLFAKKATQTKAGGKIELLLLKEKTKWHWEALVKGSAKEGTILQLPGEAKARVISDLGEGRKEILFELSEEKDLYAYLEKWGEVPLPPYILKNRKDANPPHLDDHERYQTVYAKPIGSAAAPTAGLHFTKPLIARLKKKGIPMVSITLKIGIDTFRPIGVGRLSEHQMSGEFFEISEKTADAINHAKQSGGRVIAVGTSATRTLESAANAEGVVCAMKDTTQLFITPGYKFRCVDALITNFHPPRATALVLVSAFLGYNPVSLIYQEALQREYRLFSYGDAMLIL